MKSREEQMMHHLKMCCVESKRAWEEIMDWKYQRKAVTGKLPSKKRAAPMPNTGKTGNSSSSNKRSNKGPRLSIRSEFAAAAAAGNSSATSRGTLSDQSKLKPAQLKTFQKLCTIAVASRKLDFTFFEDPVIMELMNVLRPGVVAAGQLPSKNALMGEAGENLIEKYASEHVHKEMNTIARALKLCEGLKVAVLCNLAKQPSACCASKAAPATYLCGGELSCVMVPEIQKRMPYWTPGGVMNESNPEDIQDQAIALAAGVEAQLWSMADVLGRFVKGSGKDLLQGSNDGVTEQEGDSQNTIKERQDIGLSRIGSCILTKCSMEASSTSSKYTASAVRRAHGILSLRWPMVSFTFSGCLSEQLNLLFRDLLTEINPATLLKPVEQALAAIQVLQKIQNRTMPSKDTSAPKWMEGFENVLIDEYFGGEKKNRDQVIRMLKFTGVIYYSSWLCTQQRLAFLMRIKTGCHTFANQFSTDSGFPSKCKIFSDPDFWKNIERAESLIRPLTRACLKLVPEKDPNSEDTATTSTTMADLVFVFYSLYRAWSATGLPQVAELIERRWMRYEHPWLILAFIFHPAYTQEARAFLQKQSRDDGLFSAKFLSNAILGYTVKYLGSDLAGDDPISLPTLKRQASEYMDKVESGELDDSVPMMQMKNDWKEYWSFQTSTMDLSKFVLNLLSVAVQSTTVDDMFQALVVQHTQLSSIIRGREIARHGDAQRTNLGEQLDILEKAGKPFAYKWRVTMAPKREVSLSEAHIVNPAEIFKAEADPTGNRIPSVAALPTISAPTTGTNKLGDVYGLSEREKEIPYDTEETVTEALEEWVVTKVSSDSSRRTGGVNVTKFWVDVLTHLGNDEEHEDELLQMQQQLEYDDTATDSTSQNGVENKDDLPKLTLPTYAKPAATSAKPRKARRKYRPEQINFDFVKNWQDTRGEPLGDRSALEVENVSQLKNFRANKISLSDFFDNDAIPASFDVFLNSFDPVAPFDAIAKRK